MIALPDLLAAMRRLADAVKALAASEPKVRAMYTHPALHMPDQVDDLVRYEDLGDEARIRTLFKAFVTEFVRATGNPSLDKVLGDWHREVFGRPMPGRSTGASPHASMDAAVVAAIGIRKEEEEEEMENEERGPLPAPTVTVTPAALPPRNRPAAAAEAAAPAGKPWLRWTESPVEVEAACGAQEWADAWATLSRMDQDALRLEAVTRPSLMVDLRKLLCDLVVASVGDPAAQEALQAALRAETLAETLAGVLQAGVRVPAAVRATPTGLLQRVLTALVRRVLDLSSPLATLMGDATDAENLIGSIKHLQLRRLLERMERTGDMDARLLPLAKEYQQLLADCVRYKADRRRWFATLRGYRRDARLERECPQGPGLLKRRVDKLVVLLEELAAEAAAVR